MNPNSRVTQISECFIKPEITSEESKHPVLLCSWELAMLSVHYNQKGSLFNKHHESDISSIVLKLKSSLSATLTHFYPLAGQLSTIKKQNPDSLFIFIDPQKGPGARFVHSTANVTVSDVLSPRYVPLIVQSFFHLNGAVNHDGHLKPLLSIQVTELIDGVFIGFSVNHAAIDGTSFWHFVNSWSEVFQSKNLEISRKPIHTRWFPDGYGPESLKNLKARANAEYYTNKTEQLNEISSFQALSSLVWRCITRSRFSPYDQITRCNLAINNRTRLSPELSENCFGNFIQSVRGVAASGELLEQNLGWAAMKLHDAVAHHTDKTIRDSVDEWFKSPFIYQFQNFDSCIVHIGSSPRFDMYTNGGSVDLEVSLRPQIMSSFESDEELNYAVCQFSGSVEVKYYLSIMMGG